MTDKLTYEHLYLMFDSAASLAEFASELADTAEHAADEEVGGWLKVKLPTATSPAWAASGENDASVSAPVIGITYEEVSPDWSRVA